MHRITFVAVIACTALLVAACAAPPRSPEPTSDYALEADACAVTQAFSAALRAKDAERPPAVRLARADDPSGLAYAYGVARADLERCIDPALGAVFTSGPEVLEGMPPIRATKKFDRNSVASFTDNPNDSGWGITGSLTRIELEPVRTSEGVELRLSVH